MLTPAAARALDRLYAADAAQRAAGLPPARRTRNVDRETGRFLGLVARSVGARLVFEVGSSNGVSTIWLAAVLAGTGGRVVGSELIEERAAEANANLAEAGLAGVGRVEAGDARAVVAALDGPLDLVFLDAEKDDYPAHFAAVFPRLRPGGLVLADNVTSHDLSAYQGMLRGRDDVATVTLPIERGVEYTLKLR